MGRVKLTLRRLETPSLRQVVYSKRKLGLMKKAREISILCDIDLALLTFSPLDQPTLFISENNNLVGILEKFSKMSLEERLKRKVEAIELLKKLFSKEDHEIDPEKFLPDGKFRLQELRSQLRDLQEKISVKSNKLSTWLNPEIATDPAELQAMDDSLVESLNRLQRRKGHLLERRARRPWVASQATRDPWMAQTTLMQDGQNAHPIPMELAQGGGNYSINGNIPNENVEPEVGMMFQNNNQQLEMMNQTHQYNGAGIYPDSSLPYGH